MQDALHITNGITKLSTINKLEMIQLKPNVDNM